MLSPIIITIGIIMLLYLNFIVSTEIKDDLVDK